MVKGKLRDFYDAVHKLDYEGIEGLKAEITGEDYMEMLEILPPKKMDGQTFYMSEFLSGDLTTKFSKVDGKYFAEVVDYSKIDLELNANPDPKEIKWVRRDNLKTLPFMQGSVINVALGYKNVEDVGYAHDKYYIISKDKDGKREISAYKDIGTGVKSIKAPSISIYEVK
jgi:hypothetical protein